MLLSIFQTLSENKVFLPSACGGGGTCIQCTCQVHSGGGNETRYTEKYQELGGPLESNLKYTSPTEVIEGDMFKFIVDSWTNKPLERCWQTCKKAKQDVFVDEVLK